MLQKATRRQSKDHNTGLVLRTIYLAGAISRADIARATTLTRPTVSSIVSHLMAMKLVAETGLAPSARGKPPTLLEVDKNAWRILCVDLAGRNFRGALVNLRGELMERDEAPVPEGSGGDALRGAYELIDRLAALSPAPLLGIGVGTPGLIDPERGVVREAVNLGWQDVPLRSLLEARYHKPVYLMNDSQAAALAEYAFGESRGSPHLLLIKIGRGIGAGIIVNGELFHGDGFGAGEVGQVVVHEGDPPETLESLASTQALLRRARAVVGNGLSWGQLVRRVGRGDPDLRAVVSQAGAYLGLALAHLVAALDIRNIVISGRVRELGDVFLLAAHESAARRLLPALIEGTRLTYSALGSDIVLLGCSSSILKHELRIV
ncbi:MAG: ROK family transcriptional regulator [Anaerolineales bacterium]